MKLFISIFRILAFSAFVGFSFSGYSQIFPVTGTIQLKSSSPFLSDYAAPENDDLQITLLYNDINTPVVDVKLSIQIEGSGISIRTKPNSNLLPITLTSGIPTIISGPELSAYLAAENLVFQGYTAQQYRQQAAMPDGFYQICVRVNEQGTGTALSQGLCTQAFLAVLQPPVLNTPAPCGTKIFPTDPTNIVFSWTPMHSTTFPIQYTLDLFWVPQGRNPNDIALNSTPWFSVDNIFSTAYQYGFSDLPIQVGEVYAWRVQAKEMSGRRFFSNNGQSNVCWFQYGDKCIPPISVSSEVQGAQRVLVSFENEIPVTGSVLQYREYTSNDTTWYNQNTTTNRINLTAVKANTTYEYRLYNKCGNTLSSHTAIDTFRTRKEFVNTRLSCNQNPNLPRVDSTLKLASLKVGDQVRIADFVLTITKVSGSNGRFSGECTTPVNLLNSKVTGTFTNLGVNSNYEAFDGQVDLNALKTNLADILPPELREKATAFSNTMNTYIDNIDKGLGSIENGIATGDSMLNQVNKFLEENPNLPTDIKNGLNDVKESIQTAIGNIGSGDTTSGKNILASVGELMENVLGNINETAIKLEEWLTKTLNSKYEVNLRAANSSRERLKTKRDRQRQNSSDINNNTGILGDFEIVKFGEIESGTDRTEIPITDEQNEMYKTDSEVNAFFSNYKEVEVETKDLLKAISIAIVVKIYLEDPAKFRQLKTDLQQHIADDLKKAGLEVLDDLLNGKNPELENKAQDFIQLTIDNFIDSIE
jgi:hypothetical protein